MDAQIGVAAARIEIESARAQRVFRATGHAAGEFGVFGVAFDHRGGRRPARPLGLASDGKGTGQVQVPAPDGHAIAHGRPIALDVIEIARHRIDMHVTRAQPSVRFDPARQEARVQVPRVRRAGHIARGPDLRVPGVPHGLIGRCLRQRGHGQRRREQRSRRDDEMASGQHGNPPGTLIFGLALCTWCQPLWASGRRITKPLIARPVALSSQCRAIRGEVDKL